MLSIKYHFGKLYANNFQGQLMPSKLKQLIVRYAEEKQFHERVTAIAKRENRSMTQQVLHYIEKGLEGDELSQEQRIVVEDVKREIVRKMLR